MTSTTDTTAFEALSDELDARGRLSALEAYALCDDVELLDAHVSTLTYAVDLNRPADEINRRALEVSASVTDVLRGLMFVLSESGVDVSDVCAGAASAGAGTDALDTLAGLHNFEREVEADPTRAVRFESGYCEAEALRDALGCRGGLSALEVCTLYGAALDVTSAAGAVRSFVEGGASPVDCTRAARRLMRGLTRLLSLVVHELAYGIDVASVSERAASFGASSETLAALSVDHCDKALGL